MTGRPTWIPDAALSRWRQVAGRNAQVRIPALNKVALPAFVWVKIQPPTVEVIAVLKCSALRNPRAVLFTHWIVAFTASSPALVIRWRR